MKLEDLQREVCERYRAEYWPTRDDLKVGISQNVREGAVPINGLRHVPEGETSGWYLWGGESLSTEPDFFQPLHVRHLPEWCPAVLKYLGLPPGWRFLIAGEYEDVWFDGKLLDPQ